MPASQTHQDMIDMVRRALRRRGYTKDRMFDESDGLIQVFKEVDPPAGELSRHRLAAADMVVLDEKDDPLLIVEVETGASPKTFGRSIPPYMLARDVLIPRRGHKLVGSLKLLIVVPDQPADGSKRAQLDDLERDWNSSPIVGGSQLRKLALTEMGRLDQALDRLEM